MNMENKIDRILENQADQRVSLAKIETDLRHHIKRSDNHEIEMQLNKSHINKLWIAIAALVGAGAQSAAPEIAKFLTGVL